MKLETTQLIKSILDSLDIKEIYYVDDDFEINDGPEEILPHLNIDGLDEERVANFTKLFPEEFSFDLPEEIIASSFTKLWGDLDGQEKKNLKYQIFKIKKIRINKTKNPVKKFFSKLQLPDNQIFCIGPNNWENIKDEVFKKINYEYKILCLFDQNLSKAEGFTDTGSRSGIGLLQEFLAKGNRHGTICAIVSGNFNITEEIAYWESWAKDLSISPSKFLTLSKDRLSIGDQGVSFAKGIQLTSINYVFDDIKVQTIQSIKDSSKESLKNLDKISLFDFEHIVLKKSSEEGVWEAETILRLYEILQSDNINLDFIKKGYNEKFNKAINKAFEIRELSKDTKDEIQLTNKRFELRNKELYLKGDILNNLHSPIQTGDIFSLTQLNGSSSDYILIGQPCDLMVRNDGTRKANYVHFLGIEILSKVDYHKKMGDYKTVNKSFPLHYYEPDSDKVGLIDLTNSFIVNLDILDLCVFNSEGICKLTMVENPVPPVQLSNSLMNRFNLLVGKFKQYSSNIDLAIQALAEVPESDIKKSLIAGLMPSISLDEFPTPIVPYSSGTFDFNLRREKTYRQPNASYLLGRYTKFISRDAENNDFAAPVGK